MDENGKAHLSKEILYSNNGKPKKWSCSVNCRQVSDKDVKTILSITDFFQLPLVEVWENLQNIDEGCPHGHHVKPHEMNSEIVDIEVIRLGHALPCATSMCHSKLRILRAASVHYPAL